MAWSSIPGACAGVSNSNPFVGSDILTPATTLSNHTHLHTRYSTTVHIITHIQYMHVGALSTPQMQTHKTDRSRHSDPTPRPCQHLQPSKTLIVYVLKHTCAHTHTQKCLPRLADMLHKLSKTVFLRRGV